MSLHGGRFAGGLQLLACRDAIVSLRGHPFIKDLKILFINLSSTVRDERAGSLAFVCDVK
jgi:hypothetical protein